MLRIKTPSPLVRLLGLVAELLPLAVGSATLRIVSQGSGLVLATLGAWAVGSQVAGQPLADPVQFWTLFVLVAVVKGLTRYAEQVSGHGLAFSLLARMRYQAFRHLETLAPAYPEGDSSGEVVAQLTADVDKIEVFYAHTLGPAVAWAVLSPMAALALGILADPILAAISFAGLLVVGLVLPWATWRRNRQAGLGVREKAAAIHGKMQENLRGAEDLRAMDARALRLAELDRLGKEQQDQEDTIASNNGIKDSLIELTIILTLGSMALGGTLLGLSIPVLAASLALGAAAFSPALGLGRAFDDLPETLASAGRFFALLDRKPAVDFDSGRASASWVDSTPGVHTKQVYFSRGTSRILENLSLDFAPGSHTCIVGPSGSGKTTLVRLLARFHDPERGSVRLDDQDLRSLGEDALHAAVSYLGQDTFLFNDTIEGNLRCIAPLATPADLEAALDQAGLFPGQAGRLQRSVGLRGQQLSGGERKRLALARILLQASPVVILDESFSNLDHQTRKDVRRHVLRALHGRTIIECTHELEDQEAADQVIRMGA